MYTSKNLLLLLLAFYLVSCNLDNIKNTYTIKGNVGYQEDYPLITDPWFDFNLVEDFTTKVILISGDEIIATSTDEEFEFKNLEEGKSYLVIPQSVKNGLYGTTALDFVIMRKFTEGIDELNTFGEIAADINKDNVINQIDLDLVWNCLTTHQCPESFRFVTDDYDGNGAGHLDQVPVNNLRSNVIIHFKPIAMGDVNRSF